jgi:outer membrane protein assembly factor BamA
MAKTKVYTQTQLDAAKQKLADLPDLSRDKIPAPEALKELKEQIVELASKKGYTIAEIKTALEGVGVTVTTKSISELIEAPKKRRAPNKPAA